jgi:hypothetical protein
VRLFGRIGALETVEDRDAAAIRARRVAGARRCHLWQELDPTDLVRRERGYLVSASTDDAFLVHKGAAFARDGSLISDYAPLYFYLDDGDVHVLEHQGKWSEIVYQRERAGAR